LRCYSGKFLLYISLLLIASPGFVYAAGKNVLVNVVGSTSTAMVVVASDDGGVVTADAGGALRSTVGINHFGVDQVLSKDAIQTEFSRMNLHPTTGAMRAVDHSNEFSTIAVQYIALQKRYPDLIIDVLPVHTKLGKQASFELAKTVANELASRGVRNVLLDSDAHLQRGFVSLPAGEEAVDSKPLLRADVDALPELAFR
jgi:hypothetical protein